MKIKTVGNVQNFLSACPDYNPRKEEEYIDYEHFKKLWINNKENQTEFENVIDVLKGCHLTWNEIYPKKKVKTPEEMLAYKSRLQELEYKQLTKGMEANQQDYFKVFSYLSSIYSTIYK